MNRAVKVQGIEAPIIREGDNIVDIITDRVLDTLEVETEEHIYSPHEWALLGIEGKKRCYDEDGDDYIPYIKTTYDIHDKDIIGITESVVARAAGQYITVDDIATDIGKKFGKGATIALVNPIYSRNRFAMILKGIARSAKKVIIVMPEYDEVGNPRGVNPFTGVNIEEYYKELCESENCECEIISSLILPSSNPILYCGLHDYKSWKEKLSKNSPWNPFKYGYTLADVCSDKSPDWGVLGTNKATEEKLKLFPSKDEAQRVCDGIKAKIFEKTEKNIIVMVYGDGHFHSPYLYDENGNIISGTSINEFADPVAWLSGSDTEFLNGTPNEIKLKALIDDSKINDNQINDIVNNTHSNNKNLVGKMSSMGTTPRKFGSLLASTCDLISGSGDRGTPVVLVQNYF